MLHVEPREGRTILELLREKGILLESPCNGKGLCGKCKVRILKGEVSARSAQEENFLTPEERDFGIRLACLTVPLEEVELDPLGLLREGGGGVLGSGERPDIPLAPVVTEEPIHLAPSSFEDGRSMCAALEVGGDLPLSLMRELPALEENREVCLVRYGGAPVALQTDGTLYGAGGGHRHHHGGGGAVGSAHWGKAGGGWVCQPAEGLRPGRALPHPLRH